MVRLTFVVLSLLDLSLFLYLLSFFYGWTPSLILRLAFVLSIPHAVTWMADAFVSSEDAPLSLFVAATSVNVIAALFDAVSLTLFVVAGADLAFVLPSAALFAVSLVAAIFSANARVDLPKDTERTASSVTILDVFLFGLEIVFYAIGLNRSEAYTRLIFLDAPHALLWYYSIASSKLTKRPPRFPYFVALLLGAVGLGFRIWYEVTLADAPLLVGGVVFGRIQLVLSGLLIVSSAVQLFFS